ncbi:hypothetical protein F0562_022196 [Nyssa sinensis]|uniref:MBD domain-containing protein n=1 Tax=Nyssa sinensis TaxID=561372 RepID=A0A5J5BN40_9ASTE|nr:hypothetical protein F0562_022196 [Nyssa sinensis]
MASSIDNSHNFMVTGLEIVPYVPPESKGDEGFHIPRKETPIIIPLVKVTLKPEEVEKGLNEGLVKAVPISFKLPKQCFANILRMDQDQFYYHGMSNKMFRSFAEVVRFIIYGLHPQKPYHLNEKKSQERPLVNGTESSRRTMFKRKRAPQTFVKEPIIETVEEMLGKAYQNMQNSCNTQKETMCSSPQDCGEETLETIEEILHEANQNLLNLFNTEVVEAQGLKLWL